MDAVTLFNGLAQGHDAGIKPDAPVKVRLGDGTFLDVEALEHNAEENTVTLTAAE